MYETKVVESVDIEAPRERVFDLLRDYEKRMKLSPVWEQVKVEKLTPEPLQVGTLFHVQGRSDGEVEYLSRVVEFVPNRKIVHQLSVERQTRVSWHIQDIPAGTRAIYEEAFQVGEGDEELVQAVRENIRLYLNNVKQYAELNDGVAARLLKLLLDRFLLKFSYRQRRVIVFILLLQGGMFVSFVILLLLLGLTGVIR